MLWAQHDNHGGGGDRREKESSDERGIQSYGRRSQYEKPPGPVDFNAIKALKVRGTGRSLHL